MRNGPAESETGSLYIIWIQASWDDKGCWEYDGKLSCNCSFYDKKIEEWGRAILKKNG
jgi:hypothetical protein